MISNTIQFSVYDNEPRSTEILKKIEEVIDLRYGQCVFGTIKEYAECKDINDMIMSGLTK